MILPKKIQIETTSACNAQCIMCPHNKVSREKSLMSDETFNKIVDSLSEFNHHPMIFLHKEGEPLIDTKLPFRIKKIKDTLDCTTIISTNASLLTKEKGKELIEAGLDSVIISLDGGDKEHYEAIRVGLNFETVVSNTIEFTKLNSQYGTPIIILIQYITKNTIEDEEQIQKLKEIFEPYNVKIKVKQMHSYFDACDGAMTKEKTKVQLSSCEDPFERIVINCDGNATLCCWDYNATYIVGNIKNESISELFNNSKSNAMRKLHTSLKCNNLEPCNKCNRIFGTDKISNVIIEKD